MRRTEDKEALRNLVSPIFSLHIQVRARYSRDFLFSRDRFLVLGLDCLSVGFCVTDLTRRSMISSVASSCELAPSSLPVDGDGATPPKPVEHRLK